MRKGGKFGNLGDDHDVLLYFSPSQLQQVDDVVEIDQVDDAESGDDIEKDDDVELDDGQ